MLLATERFNFVNLSKTIGVAPADPRVLLTLPAIESETIASAIYLL